MNMRKNNLEVTIRLIVVLYELLLIIFITI